MESNQLRKVFLDYFSQKGHIIKPSFSLIPDDQTVLFTVAGMVPFKNYFLRKTPITFTRAATCQKCIRTNDIENVGKTRRHHTFFEMLGNFSFGDYFKKEAIEWAWEFLTEIIKLPKNRMYISVYKDDDEAYEIWNKKMKIPEDRIFRMGKETNFWEMGTTGPCGYCSEIYFDLEGSEKGKVTLQDIENNSDRFLEIWNLVFTQFDKKADGSLVELEHKNIDTGMGLERLAAVSQGVYSNFETDLFMPIINFVSEKAKIKYRQNEKYDISLRVVADHARGMTFLIGDGVLPSNEGRGYVLRRIIRRAIRHLRILNIKELFLFDIVPIVINNMKNAYPELVSRKDYIKQIVKLEEEKFQETMDKGIEILSKEIDILKKEGKNVLSGDIVFKLYDTYGFPVEMTEEILGEHNFKIEKEKFNDLMEKQRELARKSWKGTGGAVAEKIPSAILEEIDTTKFLGYEKMREENCKVLAIIKDKQKVKEAAEGEEIYIILDRTPFYAESGGQIGDTGFLYDEQNRAEIIDTQKLDERFIHRTKVQKGKIKEAMNLTAEVDVNRRKDIMKNHSATHLLQAALRKILGPHIEQAGSYVGNDRLRFDFTHFAKIEKQDIEKIEMLVNNWIHNAFDVDVKEMDIKEAKESGAIALFEEKYAARVRTVKMGDVSFELCGGTHVKNTSEIGLFKIIDENSIAAGIRRIEAVTGHFAFELFSQYYNFILQLNETFKSQNLTDIMDKILNLIEENKKIKKQLEIQKQNEILGNVDKYINSAKQINNINLISIKLSDTDKDTIRMLGDALKAKTKKTVIFITNIAENKVNFLCIITDDLTDKLDASKIVKEISNVCGGGGGGRKNMAEAGGKDINKVKDALELLEELIRK